MTGTTIIDEVSVKEFGALIDRIQEGTGRSCVDALAYAGGKFLQSAAKAAKPGKKLRPIVANPLFKPADDSREARESARQAKGDMRRARYGVMVYHQGKEPAFRPIYRTGEFGRVRFLDKKTGQYKIVSDTGKVVVDRRFQQGAEGPSLKNDRRRKIARAGLARKTFKVMRGQLLSAPEFKARGLPRGTRNAFGQRVRKGEHYELRLSAVVSPSAHSIALDVNSQLTYLTNAYPGLASQAMASATRGLEYELKRQIAHRSAAAMRSRRAAQ